MMKLAYFSPLNPQPSGISDYSEELLPYLSASADITLFVDGFNPAERQSLSRFPILDYGRDPSVLSSLPTFDAVVYHMGNDHRYHAGMLDVMRAHPGIVVFHDFALQDFFFGLARERKDLALYLDELGTCHGDRARSEAAQAIETRGTPAMLMRPTEFPLNCSLARAAEGIIVHSRWSESRFRQLAPATPVWHIPMPVKIPSVERVAAENNDVQIASFGLITPGKGIELGLRALAGLKATHRFRYTLVGDPNPFFEVRELIRRYGMENHVTIPGYLPMAKFEEFIGTTDIALNIRERTVGETSASLCRLLTAGICSVVSNVGWYSELPDNSVVKVPLDSHTDALLSAYLRRLIEDSDLRRRIGDNARRYALAEHNLERAAAAYLNVIERVIARRPRRRLIAEVSSQLSSLAINASDTNVLRDLAEQIAKIAPVNTLEFHAVESNGSNGDQPPAPEVSIPMTMTPTSTNVASDYQTGELDLSSGRLAKLEGVDYKQAAIEYLGRLSEERRHHLRTKPFYNLAYKLPRYKNEGLDEDSHRHFCDFANMAVALALQPGSRILDVGCGSGWLSEYFARLGYDVKGIDISPDLIEMSRERVSRVPYGTDHESSVKCSFEVHDIELAPLPERFDAIICYDSLHHFENERAVIRHLADMLSIGAQLFILEGGRPLAGSASERELQSVMSEFRTLESPFDEKYLRQLLDENGFAIVGDFVSVNGLFEREMLEGTRLPLSTVPTNYNYFICKKVCDGAPASSVPDSRRPGILRARFSTKAPIDARLERNATLTIPLVARNTGDTLWLTGQTVRAGVVMPAVRIFNNAGTLVTEFHGEPLLPHAVAPGETVNLTIHVVAPNRPGFYTLKIDMVDQHISWFEQQGSEPYVLRFEVV
jgi:2-polyprenyl-3-methyl-5-hydroxy-6-metoxy-1,4-benzoquinol methylase/glycosyltransferase involved in cell wall biosynthesis